MARKKSGGGGGRKKIGGVSLFTSPEFGARPSPPSSQSGPSVSRGPPRPARVGARADRS